MNYLDKIGFQDISQFQVDFDIKYSTTDNFVQQKIYDQDFKMLHKDAALRLENATLYAKTLGYKIKIFDAFRPISAQRKMWNIVQNPDYVSNPDTGPCCHCRGIAIDLTLTKDDIEIDMGSEFDFFGGLSHHDSKDITNKQRESRIILAGIMSISGFCSIRTEWWHYQLPNYQNYEKIEYNP
ncbi:M15 family metallopeptidase [Candidatus Deianiraea vastatrix]|uniref:D-alanyl-D-alanine dipeptidase n=1 Tax=Candidatus Deianiraea vastatrix TaxID=2163644 RepID=A0A5B8XCN6_9RICK|nr:M15 family metallopeptidase [Candidatus Deianiraea vastatrix]QED23118.1 D-alanyl-D-alanine dipeptidase [Candidatus Deianiraea vastatrix]